MPNGSDKSWLRICAAIDGFRGRYGRWPTHVRTSPIVIDLLWNDLFTPQECRRIREKISLIPDGDLMAVAEDEAGARYSYEEEGPANTESLDRPTYDWFGISHSD